MGRRLSKDDAEKITIPHIVLASNGEDEAVVAQYAEVLSGKGKIGEVETYGTMHHGWSKCPLGAISCMIPELREMYSEP